MDKVLFQVDVRGRATLLEKLRDQHPERAVLGEVSFGLYVDDDARHVGYVLLEWESLKSAQAFLRSPKSHDLVAEWPIAKVLSATALRDIEQQASRIEDTASDA
jgi:quinol monooxygenase YgiN